MSEAIWTLFIFALCFVGACGFFLVVSDRDVQRMARQARRTRLANRQRALRYWLDERRGQR